MKSLILHYTYICTSQFGLDFWKVILSRCLLLACAMSIQLSSSALLCAQDLQSDSSQVAQTEKSLSQRKMIIVTGAPGEEGYISSFRSWSERWLASCQESDVSCEWIDGTQTQNDAISTASSSDKKRFLELVAAAGDSELWIVMIGHGTFDGKVAKFNLRGEDVSANELAAALSTGKGLQVVIHCFSCSGAFLPLLSRPGRIVITATKSGAEMNYSRFGDYLSSAMIDPTADLDHDQTISILEAFLMGAKKTDQFYQAEKRLATEHPLLEDGGDGKGVAASFFRGIRLDAQAAQGATIDGDLAMRIPLKPSNKDLWLNESQRQKRNELELQLRTLRLNKKSMAIDEYYRQVESIALQLAAIYKEDLKTVPDTAP